MSESLNNTDIQVFFVNTERVLLVALSNILYHSFIVIVFETVLLGNYWRLWKLLFCDEKNW